MHGRSLLYHCLSFGRWLADDLTYWATLLRHPLTYSRWYSSGQLARIRAERRVWVIMPSVAQFYVGIRFVEELRRRQPALKFLFSVGDRDTHRVARREAHPDDLVTYMPLPASLLLRRALRIVRPRACVAVMSMDPFYLLSRAHKRGTPVAWVSAETSAVNSERLASFWRKFDVDRFIDAVDVLSTNTRADRDRLVALGYDPARIEVTGPAKYDAAFPREKGVAAARALLDRAGIGPERLVLLGGSLFDGEPEVLLDLYPDLKHRFESLVLVLAPRAVSQSSRIMRDIERRGLHGVRRSRLEAMPAGVNGRGAPDVLLVDTIGELKGLYAWASVVFVGRTLTFFTGSNLMEPAGHARPIVVGPKFEHFQDVLQDFLAAEAVYQVKDSAELRRVLVDLLENAGLRAEYGRRAYEVITRNAGSLRRTVDFFERTWLRPETPTPEPASDRLTALSQTSRP